jgi:hypothetical protein
MSGDYSDVLVNLLDGIDNGESRGWPEEDDETFLNQVKVLFETDLVQCLGHREHIIPRLMNSLSVSQGMASCSTR